MTINNIQIKSTSGSNLNQLQININSSSQGSLIAVAIWGTGTTSTISNVTDNSNNIYLKANETTAYSNSGFNSEIWYSKNSIVGTNLITITYSSVNAYVGGFVAEFSGIDTISPLQEVGALSNPPATQSPYGAAVTTTYNEDAIFTIILSEMSIDGLYSGNEFTIYPIIEQGNACATLITTTLGTHQARFTQSASYNTCSSTVAFKSSLSLQPGSISGNVKNILGTNIQGATISNSFTSTTSDMNGNYILSNIQPGIYIITASASGYVTNSISNVSVSSEITTTNINFILNIPSPSKYPLKVSANKQYLIDNNNLPYLMVGESMQRLIIGLSVTEAAEYFALRSSQGINAMWVNLLCRGGTGNVSSAGETFDNIYPFNTTNDLSTPNEAYFARVDALINLASQYNICIFLDPIETIDHLSVLRSNGIIKARQYGNYLGNRYNNFDNIVWASGNDFQSWTTSSDDALVREVANGIKDYDTRHIQTVMLDYYDSSSLDDSTWIPIISLDSTYTYYGPYAEIYKEYNKSSPLPIIYVEGNYEGDGLQGYPTTPRIIRKQVYWAILSGSFAGHMYGHTYNWHYDLSWRDYQYPPGLLQWTYAARLFLSKRWYELVPDQNHIVVISGYGSNGLMDSIDTGTYLTVARTPDGSLIIAYIPTIRTITVDMTKLSAPVMAYWFDPTNELYLAIAGSPFTNIGTKQFTPPGNNNGGDGDWILILENQTCPVPICNINITEL